MGIIIGIGGVSRAGKTSLAKSIYEWFNDDKIKIIRQDEYVIPKTSMPLINGQLDWERPESMDFIAFRNAILSAKNHYNYVITEGLMIYYDPQVYALFDKKIYIEISKETFLSRKALDFRWEKEPDWYIEHIWNSHFIYGRVPKGTKDVLCMSGENQFIADIVKNYILN